MTSAVNTTGSKDLLTLAIKECINAIALFESRIKRCLSDVLTEEMARAVLIDILMGSHQEVQQKLYEEISKIKGLKNPCHCQAETVCHIHVQGPA